ncbi:MAG: HAD hydrolase-like protein, partial [Clostridia bacterium]|nr:HAD hydrolase-like protein [Clostridia bacterium]
MRFADASVILFDLDGTIVDSSLGITNSVMYALARYGFPIPPRKELYFFVGPPLNESFERLCGFSREESFAAVEVYREYYREHGVFENAIYPGMRALFAALKARGKQIWLATSKPEVFAEKIAERFGFAQYLDGVVGSLLDGRRVKKDEVVAEALLRAGVTDPTQAVMVG